MTKKIIGPFVMLIALLSLGLGVFTRPERVFASRSDAGVGPNRKTTIRVSYTTYEWWLAAWRNNQVACQVYIEHEGLPDAGEVWYYCGDAIYNAWQATSACKLVHRASTAGPISTCSTP